MAASEVAVRERRIAAACRFLSSHSCKRAPLCHHRGADEPARTVPGELQSDLLMPQAITTHVRALVEAAEREVETLSVGQAIALHGRDDVVFVDIRDIRELN